MAKRKPWPYYSPVHHRTADNIRADLARVFRNIIYGAIGFGLLIAWALLAAANK